MHIILETVAWLAIASWLSSCAEGEDGARAGYMTTSARGPGSEWCATMCNTYQRCESQVGYGCVTSCLDGNRAYLARRSAAALEFEMQCMTTAVCTDDFDELLSTCFTDSLTGLDPTGDAGQLCDDLADEFFACNWFPSRDSCARFHAGYSAGALLSERSCGSPSCEGLDACIVEHLYEYGE